jgi:hypothetical protein
MKQFSIRDLLLAILIIALALGWWLDRRPVAARFQMQVTNGNRIFVLDTASGEVIDTGSGDVWKWPSRAANSK